MHSATVPTLQLSADVDLLRDNVHAVTRALRILEAFEPHEQGVRLTDLSERLGMEKSTVLRTARTLARSGYLTQLADGRWRLGPSAGLIGVRYQTALDATNDIDSVLRRLATDTHETAALWRSVHIRHCQETRPRRTGDSLRHIARVEPKSVQGIGQNRLEPTLARKQRMAPDTMRGNVDLGNHEILKNQVAIALQAFGHLARDVLALLFQAGSYRQWC